MRKFLKKITHPFLKFGLRLYYSKPRPYSYEGIKVVVHPDVFPPHLTLSTKILLEFTKQLPLKNATFLELGCGSGILSLYAAKKGAIVTATDINKLALKYLEEAAKKNDLKLNVLYSDLFSALKNQDFEYILINPPYYPKNPTSTKEKAWFCGKNHDYFIALFNQLPVFIAKGNKTYMILSEDCNLSKINEIAKSNAISLDLITTKRRMGEANYIYRLERSSQSH